jgi:hypothetical protein
MHVSDAHHFRKTVAGACMLVAPALLLVAALIAPKFDSDGSTQLAYAARHLDRWLITQLLSLAALALLVPAILGLMHMLRERQVAMGHVGGALALLGTLAATAGTGVGFAFWQMAEPGRDAAQMGRLADDIVGSAGVVIPIFIVTIGLPLGVIALCYGLYRARAVHPLSIALLGVGSILLELGFGPVASNALAIIGGAATTIGLGSIGWQVLTESDEAWEHTPEFRGFGPAAA